MKPPKVFIPNRKTQLHKKLCIACNRLHWCMSFHNEGMWWDLCRECYADYWENTDELTEDFRGIV